MIVLSLRFRLRRELAATWKLDQRPAWMNVEFAVATARRVQRTYTVGAKKAPDVRCLAAEVSVLIRRLFFVRFFYSLNENGAYKRGQMPDTTFRELFLCDYFSPRINVSKSVGAQCFNSVENTIYDFHCRVKYNNTITISITELNSPQRLLCFEL